MLFNAATVGSEVLTAELMRSSIFWDITVCSTLKVHWLSMDHALYQKRQNSPMWQLVFSEYFGFLCQSDLGVSAPSMCNVARCSFIRHYFTTCFSLNGHLQVYRLLYFRTLLLTVMQFCFSVVIASCYFWLCGCQFSFNQLLHIHKSSSYWCYMVLTLTSSLNNKLIKTNYTTSITVPTSPPNMSLSTVLTSELPIVMVTSSRQMLG
jgi:hypothetical protein